VDGECRACDITCTAGDHICANTALQAEVAAGGTVYVCPGRYTGNLTLTQDVRLIGAGEGVDDAVDTVLDALASGTVVRNDVGVTAALRQVWITNGRGDNGAGVQNRGTLTMTTCTISGNTAPHFLGGGVHTSSSGSLEMIDCTIHSNSASDSTGNAGGLLIAGPATLTNCTIGPNNTAGAAGGAIMLLNSTSGPLTLNGCTVSGNRAMYSGGIENDGAKVTLNGGSVTGNTATSGTDDIRNSGRLISNDAVIGECVDQIPGCGCPGGTVCP
jgi:hypothetical protein